MNNQELKPCPCGEEAEMDYQGASVEAIVRCTSCSFAAFATDWNLRREEENHDGQPRYDRNEVAKQLKEKGLGGQCDL